MWTGLGALLRGNLNMPGFSYLWMFPIYGSAVILEPVHEHIRVLPWYIRGIIWMMVIFSIEYVSGWLIRQSIGTVPWDYSGSSPYALSGLIRLDYAPVWFGVGLLFEKAHDYLRVKHD